MPKNRDIPQELIDAGKAFQDIAHKHGFRVMGCAFHPSSDNIKAGSVSIFKTSVCDFRIMVEQIVAAMNEQLMTPIELHPEWIPWERLGQEVEDETKKID